MTTAGLACGTCGSELYENGRFCHTCGSPITEAHKVAGYKQVTV
jgi:predicted amidophosphoribosyltransferase